MTRILVVDDHELVRRGICSILATDPKLTVCAEAVDGRDAVQKARNERPDIVVMDISMPNMNGLDAARELRKLLPSAQLFLFSAFYTENLEEIARSAGIDAYIPKSDIETLLSRVSQFAAA